MKYVKPEEELMQGQYYQKKLKRLHKKKIKLQP